MKSISRIDIANFYVSKFARTEVLFDKDQKAERKNQLLRAMLLNYLEHQSVTIYFKNNLDDLFFIDCSVIAVTDEHAMLKSGLIIPVQSIISIELV